MQQLSVVLHHMAACSAAKIASCFVLPVQERGANIICEYLGGAVNCDAHHMTDPRADGLGVSTCIKLALEDAQITEREQVRVSLLWVQNACEHG